MKTLLKSQYLELKEKQQYELFFKNQTVQIPDAEYENLMQYKDITYDDNNNLKGARLIYKDHDKNKKIKHITYGDSDSYENSVRIFEIDSEHHGYFYIIFNNGTYKKVYTSELLFKLKNNIGELKYHKNNDYNLDCYLDYKYPNELDSDIIQETVIAEYKGLTCEFCDIYVYKNRIYVIGEWTGNSFLPNSYLVWNNRQYDVTHIKISFADYGYGELQEHTENENVSLFSYFTWKYEHNNIILDFYEDKRTYEITDVIINNYMFTGSINNVQFSLYRYDWENRNKNIGINNYVLPKLKSLNTLLIQYDLKSYHQEYCGEIFTEYDIQIQKSRWVAFTFFAGSNNYINNNYNPTQYDIDPNISIENQLTNEQLENCYLIYDKGYLGHKTWFSQIYKNDNVDYYTYISPMYNSFNNKIWKPLMNKLNSWINSLGENDNHELYITIGCTIDNNQILTINNGVYVPKYYYVAILKNNIESVIGFYIEHKEYNENNNINLSDYIVSIDELEQLTGIDFFCDLPDDVENQIEQISKEQLIRELNI